MKMQHEIDNFQNTYQSLMRFMRSLRNYFIKHYPIGYAIGSLYPGDMTISYFPFTPIQLKEKKLKIAIVFNHKEMRFEVWLAGQNKQIQKEYWEIFKGSDWNQYHIPSSIENGFSIVDHVLVEDPDFENAKALVDQIESQTLKFIQEIEKVLV
jgi:AraC family transcriptional regulator